MIIKFLIQPTYTLLLTKNWWAPRQLHLWGQVQGETPLRARGRCIPLQEKRIEKMPIRLPNHGRGSCAKLGHSENDKQTFLVDCTQAKYSTPNGLYLAR